MNRRNPVQPKGPKRLYAWLRAGGAGKVVHVVPPLRTSHTVCGRKLYSNWVQEEARPDPATGHVYGYPICAECNRMKDADTMQVQGRLPGAGPKWTPLQAAINRIHEEAETVRNWIQDDTSVIQDQHLYAAVDMLSSAARLLEAFRALKEKEEQTNAAPPRSV